MTTFVIKGPPKSGRTSVAQGLRLFAQSRGAGVLILDETTQGEPHRLLEKLLVLRENLPDNKRIDVEALTTAKAWKPHPVLVVVASPATDALLAGIEEVAPGFAAALGPVHTITTS